MSFKVTDNKRIGVELDDQLTDMQNWLTVPAGYDGQDYHAFGVDSQGRQASRQYIWDTDTLQWVAGNSAGGAVGGGSASVTYQVAMDDHGTYLYVGESVPGTATSADSWRIKKVTDSGVLFADSTAAFIKKWDDRAVYTY
jgi:hypothetical protein